VALRRRRHAAPPPFAPAIDTAPAPEPWPAEPDLAVAVDEAPDAWTAATEAIDVTDHTIELPALAPISRRRAARAGRAALTLGLVLGCAGAAVAATGVLESKPQETPPPTIGDASVVAAAKPHASKPAHHRAQKRTHHKRARRARHHPAAPRVAAAAPAPSPRAGRAGLTTTAAPAPVRHVVSRPAPKPANPKPSSPKPAAAPQPAASAPSGEPGRQPPSSP
jgi:hypothetical protein